MITLEERLRSEARICPRCSYETASPFTERCPRCLTALPAIDPGCGRCIHSSGCPASGARKVEPKPSLA